MLEALEIIGITLLSAVIAAVAQYLYKRNMEEFDFKLDQIIATFMKRDIMIGGVLYGLSLIVYLYALDNAPLISFVYPIFASTFVFVLLISKLVLHERINLHRVFGVLLIIAGIVVISLTFPVQI